MITAEQIRRYHDQGFLMLDTVFTKDEIDSLHKELPVLLEDQGPRKVLESNGEIRSYYGVHQVNDIYKKISQSQRIIGPIKQILESEVYIYQTKINFKKGLRGEWWEWHQDFPYWKIEDGMESPRVLSVMIYLDDVTEFNGPLMVIPGSHKQGMVAFDDKNDGENEETWTGNNLKYTIDKSILEKGFKENNVFSATGKAGSVLIFHGNVFHGSNCNMSPLDRKTLIITYNSVENALCETKVKRPEFLSERNVAPVVAEV